MAGQPAYGTNARLACTAEPGGPTTSTRGRSASSKSAAAAAPALPGKLSVRVPAASRIGRDARQWGPHDTRSTEYGRPGAGGVIARVRGVPRSCGSGRRACPDEGRQPPAGRHPAHRHQVIAYSPGRDAYLLHPSGAKRRLSSVSRWHAAARASGVVKSRKPKLTGFFSLQARSPAKNTVAECVSGNPRRRRQPSRAGPVHLAVGCIRAAGVAAVGALVSALHGGRSGPTVRA